MKEEFNCGGREPLQLCWACADLGIKSAMTNTATSFLEESATQSIQKRLKQKMRDLGAKKSKKQVF